MLGRFDDRGDSCEPEDVGVAVLGLGGVVGKGVDMFSNLLFRRRWCGNDLIRDTLNLILPGRC